MKLNARWKLLDTQKVKSTVKVCACDDLLCKDCSEDNEAKLRLTGVSDNNGPAANDVGSECKMKAISDGMLSRDICGGQH